MTLERKLQICVATMAVLATMLLGIEQRDPTLTIAVAFAAVTSVTLTDWLGWFSLHRWLANLAALAALAVTMMRVAGQPTEAQLLAVADLLVYLQIILLYQVKMTRLYWQLAALSLLQVVVAAALNLVFIFGVLLVIYLFVALAGLSLFFVYREVQCVQQAGTGIVVMGGGSPSAPIAVQDRSARETLTTKGLLRQTSWMSVVTLVTTIVVFFLLPRHEAIWKRSRSQNQRLVGFTEEVNLEDLGPILESPETVMRVYFYRHPTNEPYRIWGEPYFRGAVVVNYQPKSGRWSRASFRDNAPVPAMPEDSNITRFVRQEVVLEPGEHSVLFSVMPANRVAQTPNQVRFDAISQLLFIDDMEGLDEKAKLRFSVVTNVFERGIQQALRPALVRVPPLELLAYSHFGPRHAEHLGGLAELARRTLAESGVDPADDPLGAARALEAHFLAANRYYYSLDNSKKRRFDIDPLEDFVTNHRTGHCEYFASALTLMLRSVGLPARMVIGYKGGEYNSLGNYYQVRQLHAHAWVELFLAPQHLRNLQGTDRPEFEHGAWLRLDPTPSTDDPTAGLRTSGIMGRLAHLFDYAQLWWSDYVLGMNSERQRRAIYQPLVIGARATWHGLVSGEVWEARLRALGRRLGLENLSRRHVDWQLILITVFLAIMLLGLLYAVQGAVRQVVRALWMALRYPISRSRRTDNLFRRMERLLARRGIVRPRSQTPREFAIQVQQRLTPQANGDPSHDLPRRIVDAFYRTRYGRQTLDSGLLDQLQHDLADWEKGVLRRAL